MLDRSLARTKSTTTRDGKLMELIWMKTEDENGMYSQAAPFEVNSVANARSAFNKATRQESFRAPADTERGRGRPCSLPTTLFIMFWAAPR